VQHDALDRAERQLQKARARRGEGGRVARAQAAPEVTISTPRPSMRCSSGRTSG
jgi:hypothetical protein